MGGSGDFLVMSGGFRQFRMKFGDKQLQSHPTIMKIKFLPLFLSALCFALQTFGLETQPLAGEWRFAIDRQDAGLAEKWFSKNLALTFNSTNVPFAPLWNTSNRADKGEVGGTLNAHLKIAGKIKLPGILEQQGYGDEISINTPWVLSLYDHFWFLRADYAAYTNAGNTKVPFLSQPERHYVGAAWYQRDIEIPKDWDGKRVTLFMERPHWKSTVWLDDKEIGSDLSLCVPHEYDFGIMSPGKHRLTVRVDNRMILPYRLDAHSVSDSLDDAWNGIIGKIELRATAPVWADDIRIFANATNKTINVRYMLHNVSGRAASGKISFNIESCAGTKPVSVLGSSQNFNNWSETNTQMEGELGTHVDEAGLWSEFSPSLYKLHIEVAADTDKLTHEETTRVFAFRDLHTEGNQFILNGHPMYFRGTHFGGDFPITGYPPTDVDSWKKIFQTCKDYGLNHMRFHSWCPPEAAFEAADELGFYLQVECGMWNEFSPGGVMEKQLYSETERIICKFGNHPSLMLISASNEAHGNWKPVLSQWVKHFREEDPRHLYTPDTGWGLIDNASQPINGGADYLVLGRMGLSPLRGNRGWFGNDYREATAGVPVPIIGHEVGQWVAYPDYDVIKEFTGFMRPGNFEIFRDSAKAHGVLDENKEFAHASGRFQLACYKEEIEANLRTPGMGGVQLLDLHDYTGQGTALVGLLDPLWRSKGYTTPEEFREFCNAVVPLARLKQRTFTTAETLNAPVEAANYSAAALTNAEAKWVISNAKGRVFAEGNFSSATIPVGKNFSIGNISADLSKLPAPAAYQLEVHIRPTSGGGPSGTVYPAFENGWNFWLYPAQISNSVPADVLVTSSWADAEHTLSAGGKVLFLPHNADLDWSNPPLSRTPVFWNALMGPTWTRMLGLWCDTKHPALAEFPTEANCDWQWTELLRNIRAVNLDHLPKNLRPIVSAIDDWNRNYKLGLIFEARVGSGKLLVCAADLNSSPVAQQLRRSLLDYMGGHQFAPRTEISVADFEGLHFNSRIMRALGATATANGRRANEIVDGDPNTSWSSADARGNGPKGPHEIRISFPQPVAMRGLLLMPRQNQREHQGDIREYKLESSDDGTNWQSIASGQLASTFDEQPIAFGKTVTTKELRLTALSGFGKDTSAGLAELAVIYAGPKLNGENSGDVEYKDVRTATPEIDAGDSATKPAPKR
jgi:beta-galactosidase